MTMIGESAIQEFMVAVAPSRLYSRDRVQIERLPGGEAREPSAAGGKGQIVPQEIEYVIAHRHSLLGRTPANRLVQCFRHVFDLDEAHAQG